MIKKSFFFLMLIVCQLAHATSYPVQLGNQRVVIEKRQHKKGPLFIHLHQNEKTALQAARSVVASTGGSVLTLRHNGGRNVIFYLKKQRYEFDPNRIFTQKGIKKTLSLYGAYSKEAHQEVKKLADKIKILLPKGKVIAVHNNQSYSLKNYNKGQALAGEARAVYVDSKQYYRNFFLVTQKNDFLRLKNLNYNSVWQKSHPVDDGSLSVYLANGTYINVEAAHHQLQSQIRMLKNAAI